MQGHQNRGKKTMNLDTVKFCYIGSINGIGWVSALLYYHIRLLYYISHQTNYRLTGQETRFYFLIVLGRIELLETKEDNTIIY